MDLTFTSDQEQLSSLTAKYARAELPLSRWHLNGAATSEGKFLGKAAELGWLAMNPSMDGQDLGFNLIDEVLVFRELGRQLAGLSIFAATVAAKLAHASGCNELSVELSEGRHIVAVGVKDYRSGAAAYRLFSNGRPGLALVFGSGAASLFAVEGPRLVPAPCLEPMHDMFHSIELRTEPLARSSTARLFREARLLLAAMNVGQAEASCEMITEYAKVRQTFGRPIGAYQAVRHPIAEMAARAKQAEILTYYASLASDEDMEDCEYLCNSALRLSFQAAKKNADANIQLHGGIGITDDLDAHLFMKRPLLSGLLFRAKVGAGNT